jgi:hypothetical protein
LLSLLLVLSSALPIAVLWFRVVGSTRLAVMLALVPVLAGVLAAAESAALLCRIEVSPAERPGLTELAEQVGVWKLRIVSLSTGLVLTGMSMLMGRWLFRHARRVRSSV